MVCALHFNKNDDPKWCNFPKRGCEGGGCFQNTVNNPMELEKIKRGFV